MRDFFVNNFTEFAGGLFIALLTFAVKKMYGKVKRLELVENGVQALLRDSIIKSYNHYTDKGYCPIYALESLTKMYDEYHALGGNGTVTKLINEIKELPTEPPKNFNKRCN
ncbi:MAG: hypothetical protein RR911_05900 [Oscillospiraceae bacterium]